jgi:hypothetical protein
VDFSKIKDGVLAFSSFLVTHVAWLVATLYSLWAALGSERAEPLSNALNSALATLNRQDITSVLDDYGLKPLVPALVFFIGLFVLHAHRELLARAGRYVPPDLVMYWMPGLPSVGAGRWHYVLSQLPASFSLHGIRSILESRYDAAVERRRPENLLLSFNMFKALAALNLLLAIVPSNPQRWVNLTAFGAFVAASAVSAMLHVYHARLVSSWAIEDVLRNLIAEQVLEGHGTLRQLNDTEVKEIREFVRAEEQVRAVSFSWNVPFIGSVRILSETLRRRRRKARYSDPIPDDRARDAR